MNPNDQGIESVIADEAPRAGRRGGIGLGSSPPSLYSDLPC